jgi:hypothetical protein
MREREREEQEAVKKLLYPRFVVFGGFTESFVALDLETAVLGQGVWYDGYDLAEC